jgi:dCMP deaminase
MTFEKKLAAKIIGSRSLSDANVVELIKSELTFCNEDWIHRFLFLAKIIGYWSKDDSTKCGCVIVGPDYEIRSTGYNGLPRGISYDDTARLERPEKYFWFEHGERNAIYNAARMGTPLKGCYAFVTHSPCHNCASALIQAGITRVYVPASGDMIVDPPEGRDIITYLRGEEILHLGKVEYIRVDNV